MKPLLLRGPYFFRHDENKMAFEGNLEEARRIYYDKKPNNLVFLMHKRYEWMNTYCDGKKNIVEVGSGTAFSRDFIRNKNLVVTDCIKQPWIDRREDALHTSFGPDSVDVIISSHVIHHLAQPMLFFREAIRILRPRGKLLIQEVEIGLILRIIMRLMRHEGWSYDAKPFEENYICCDPLDPWSANNAVPHLLFQNGSDFERKVKGFKIIENALCECLIVPLAGGIISKTRTIHLPNPLLRIIDRLDTLLIDLAPRIFAMGRRVVLEKIDD